MGIILTYDQVVVGVALTALITGNYPCGDAGSSHKKNETAGKMLAETPLTIEQKLVHRMFAQYWRL